MKVAVVDYGMGNLRGVKLAIERAGGRAVITNDPAEVTEADAIVLPGVGAFKDAMERLRSIEEVVKDQIRAGKPLLGICLGLQLLFTESMEGGLHRGLDLLKGRVVKLPAGVKVPHMGWNKVNIAKWTRFVEDLPQGAYMYFVHSFYADPLNKDVVLATTEYGVKFPSIVEADPLYATQFHPEKSGKTGLKLLRNFISIAKR